MYVNEKNLKVRHRHARAPITAIHRKVATKCCRVGDRHSELRYTLIRVQQKLNSGILGWRHSSCLVSIGNLFHARSGRSMAGSVPLGPGPVVRFESLACSLGLGLHRCRRDHLI